VKTGKKIAIGTIIAAAAGYVAGILTAPKSGKETRSDIKDAASHGLVEAEKQLKKLHTELSGLLNRAREVASTLKGTAREDLEKSMEAAKVAKEKAREILSAVHEGDAQDEDLKVAIAQTKEAVEHLESFLSKKS